MNRPSAPFLGCQPYFSPKAEALRPDSESLGIPFLRTFSLLVRFVSPPLNGVPFPGMHLDNRLGAMQGEWGMTSSGGLRSNATRAEGKH